MPFLLCTTHASHLHFLARTCATQFPCCAPVALLLCFLAHCPAGSELFYYIPLWLFLYTRPNYRTDDWHKICGTWVFITSTHQPLLPVPPFDLRIIHRKNRFAWKMILYPELSFLPNIPVNAGEWVDFECVGDQELVNFEIKCNFVGFYLLSRQLFDVLPLTNCMVILTQYLFIVEFEFWLFTLAL